MFNFEEKLEYIQGKKVYTRRGKENCYPIGKIVKIDWDLQSEYCKGINSLSELDEKILKWVNKFDQYVVTDVSNWGTYNTVTLDHRFTVSAYRLYDVYTQKYILEFVNANGGGFYQTPVDKVDKTTSYSEIPVYAMELNAERGEVYINIPSEKRRIILTEKDLEHLKGDLDFIKAYKRGYFDDYYKNLEKGKDR